MAYFIVDNAVVETAQNYVGLKPWDLYFEGLSHSEGTRIRVLVVSPKGILTKFKFRAMNHCSNNEAEYEALILDLEILLNTGGKRVVIRYDSKLVLKQLNEEYKCTKENLISYFILARSLLEKFESIDVIYIPRLQNQEANVMDQISSGYKVPKDKLEELIKVIRI